MNATALSLFHLPAEPGDIAALRDWLTGMSALASAAPGFVESGAALFGRGPFEPGVAATFRTEDLAHAFLDSPARARMLAQGQERGFRLRSADLVVVDDELPPPGIGVFRHSVIPGHEDEFLSTEVRLSGLSADFPGFEGVALFRVGASDRWFSVLRFRTAHHLSEWMRSDRRAEALPALRAELTEDFSVVAHTTPFGSTLRTVNGETRVTPTWKIAMLVLLVLYPTVMTLSRFLGPVLDDLGTPPWLAMWLSQIVSVAAMSWVLSPAVAACFRRWLDPVDGAGWRAGARGAAVVVVLYALTLLLFATVEWLDYWNHP